MNGDGAGGDGPHGTSAVHIEAASEAHREAFLDAVARSTRLHHPWVSPPATAEAFAAYLQKYEGDAHFAYLAVLDSGELAGVINVSQIVRGPFQSAFLGYYGFVPHAGKGHMSTALALVVTRAFRRLGLHRLEANIQPGNTPSIALVRRLGFRKEGFSERYLKIGGRWRDHERWAITREVWRPPR